MNVAHRDIKLENVLLISNNLSEENTQIKLIDFGFSYEMPNSHKIKIFCGTPSYMAPEIVSRREHCGPPVDIWASGVLLFALLAGYFPFRASSDKELYKKINKGEIIFPDWISFEA